MSLGRLVRVSKGRERRAASIRSGCGVAAALDDLAVAVIREYSHGAERAQAVELGDVAVEPVGLADIRDGVFEVSPPAQFRVRKGHDRRSRLWMSSLTKALSAYFC